MLISKVIVGNTDEKGSFGYSTENGYSTLPSLELQSTLTPSANRGSFAEEPKGFDDTECGKKKGCLFAPPGCQQKKNCLISFSYQVCFERVLNCTHNC
ncbi:hypothetical protein COOONC_18145 [Cooperia oncophora]